MINSGYEAGDAESGVSRRISPALTRRKRIRSELRHMGNESNPNQPSAVGFGAGVSGMSPDDCPPCPDDGSAVPAGGGAAVVLAVARAT
jgi:hypothetical protein